MCEYNALTIAGGQSSEIGITEALDLHIIEGQITEFSSVCNTVATGRKKQIMNAYLSLCRLNEELSLLKKENVITFAVIIINDKNPFCHTMLMKGINLTVWSSSIVVSLTSNNQSFYQTSRRTPATKIFIDCFIS